LSKAHVTSVEALEAFRNSLVLFLEKANRALNEIGDQVSRTRTWTHFDQPNHWLNECRKRKRTLDQTEAELYTARLSEWNENTAQLKIIVKRCRLAVEEAETKLRQVKKWGRDFDQRVTPLARKVDGLQYLLEQDMPKALAFIDSATTNLRRYTESSRPTEPTQASDDPVSDKSLDQDPKSKTKQPNERKQQ